jgi:glycoprotein endo-alpha-1,2-mannosidase
MWRDLVAAVLFLLNLQSGSGACCEGRSFLFYYLWYGNEASDGRWQHWNHKVLPHWTPRVNAQFPEVGASHAPPERLHSPYYPARGPYSSSNFSLLVSHFHEIRALDERLVVVLSWWGQPTRVPPAVVQCLPAAL